MAFLIAMILSSDVIAIKAHISGMDEAPLL